MVIERAKRYEQLAETLSALIRDGRLQPGARMPAVRVVSAQHHVSPSTVFQAYELMESRGLIRARARSGHYVNEQAQRVLDEPSSSRPAAQLSEVDVSQRVFSILRAVKDPQVVPLGSAFPSPELFPWARLKQSLASANRLVSPWSAVMHLPAGNELLRRQIAWRHLAAGMSVSADDVIITNGALEGLNLCLQAVTRPGDVVAIESPGFYAAQQALERLSLRAVEIPVDPREGVNLAALTDVLRRDSIRACWFMTNYQNPVGALMPDAKKRELVQLLARHEVPLIEDDVYSELYFGDTYRLPAKMYDENGLVMYCSSFSKTLAPGYRVGWVLPGRFGEKVEQLKLMTTLSASVPAQVAIADYLQRGSYDRHLRKMRIALESQYQQMVQSIAQHFPFEVKVTRPQGGYFLWLELPEHIDALVVHQRALAQGISLAPGPIFSIKQEYKNFIRLNFGHAHTDKIEQALVTLGGIVAAML
ncbi:MAG: transcriptional regulator MocR family [Verrucomicrobiaceae bacterium]|nr:transcriptional regulator MocR family [Verrucomicrobiaceae bacterium]